MGTHRRPERRRRAMLDPLLVAFLLVGVAFVGVALASQRTLPGVESVGGPTSSLPVSEVRPEAPEERPADVLSESPPVALDINAIEVHSHVHELGLDPAGAIETPSGTRYDEAAWFRYSPTPGSLGPSIILGHVDSASNGPSVFFRLGELVRGDRISVTRADGSIARFIVQELARYSKADFPTERVYGNLGHAGLRLITCGGEFDDASGHYEDNIIVFARLDGSSS